MMKSLYLTLLLLSVAGVSLSAGPSKHSLSGKIYFTNNTPDYETFPVELYSRNQKRRLIAGHVAANGDFKLTGIKPGKYLLKFTWPNRCTLWYRVTVPADSNKRIRVIMDAACAHHDGTIQDLTDN
jgi:hypothetical protein